jgi:hypothetical protein
VHPLPVVSQGREVDLLCPGSLCAKSWKRHGGLQREGWMRSVRMKRQGKKLAHSAVSPARIFSASKTTAKERVINPRQRPAGNSGCGFKKVVARTVRVIFLENAQSHLGDLNREGLSTNRALRERFATFMFSTS